MRGVQPFGASLRSSAATHWRWWFSLLVPSPGRPAPCVTQSRPASIHCTRRRACAPALRASCPLRTPSPARSWRPSRNTRRLQAGAVGGGVGARRTDRMAPHGRHRRAATGMWRTRPRQPPTRGRLQLEQREEEERQQAACWCADQGRLAQVLLARRAHRSHHAAHAVVDCTVCWSSMASSLVAKGCSRKSNSFGKGSRIHSSAAQAAALGNLH
jgi:hypothetical protein